MKSLLRTAIYTLVGAAIVFAFAFTTSAVISQNYSAVTIVVHGKALNVAENFPSNDQGSGDTRSGNWWWLTDEVQAWGYLPHWTDYPAGRWVIEKRRSSTPRSIEVMSLSEFEPDKVYLSRFVHDDLKFDDKKPSIYSQPGNLSDSGTRWFMRHFEVHEDAWVQHHRNSIFRRWDEDDLGWMSDADLRSLDRHLHALDVIAGKARGLGPPNWLRPWDTGSWWITFTVTDWSVLDQFRSGSVKESVSYLWKRDLVFAAYVSIFGAVVGFLICWRRLIKRALFGTGKIAVGVGKIGSKASHAIDDKLDELNK